MCKERGRDGSSGVSRILVRGMLKYARANFLTHPLIKSKDRRSTVPEHSTRRPSTQSYGPKLAVSKFLAV